MAEQKKPKRPNAIILLVVLLAIVAVLLLAAKCPIPIPVPASPPAPTEPKVEAKMQERTSPYEVGTAPLKPQPDLGLPQP